ncbi:hypothetical protein KM043_018183 [Ampulex compressa]|nr:hypothetical protein KM043_018183 [Ampulex compressa]
MRVMSEREGMGKGEKECDERTHSGQSRESCGGVGRNVANALINLGLDDTLLISVVGNDDPGKAIIKSLGKSGRTVEQLPNVKTARYTATVDRHGECYVGIGEMEWAAFAAIDPSLIRKHESHVKRSSLIILDGNLPLDTIHYVMNIAVQYSIPGQ